MGPVLDGRKEQELLQEIRKLAKAYVPDWRFCEDMAEPGSVIAKLFAELMAETVTVFDENLERNREAFLKSQGMNQKEGGHAEGTMVFKLVKPDMPSAVVPSGAVVLAKGKEGQVAFETCEEVLVTGNRVGMAHVRAVKPGDRGNLPPGGGYKLESSVGFVSLIENLKPVTGGTDRETLKAAMERSESAFRHQYRAVTPGDYENLVREQYREVELVRCFPGYGGDGRRRTGAVTVVVLQLGKMEGSPYYYGKTQEIRQYLMGCTEPAVWRNELAVIMPEFIRMDVMAELYTGPENDRDQVRQAAEKALEQFFHPLEGGNQGGGWHLGALPPYGQIKACLQSTPGVSYDRRITVEWKRKRDGHWEDIAWEEVKQIPWSLPVNGTHRILVKGAGGQDEDVERNNRISERTYHGA